eukprot:13967992-Alexandrium_andersonii.AAC.1
MSGLAEPAHRPTPHATQLRTCIICTVLTKRTAGQEEHPEMQHIPYIELDCSEMPRSGNGLQSSCWPAISSCSTSLGRDFQG